MERLHFDGNVLTAAPVALTGHGFVWLDYSHDEVGADPQGWSAEIANIVGEQLFEEHVIDCVNMQHPSFFDDTHSYDMIIFRKLAMPRELTGVRARSAKGAPSILEAINTRPITIFCFDHALVTVRSMDSQIIKGFKTRLVQSAERRDLSGNGKVGNRLPMRPDELMLRLISVLVDSYMDLRQPLTDQVDRWQNEMLGKTQTFSDWRAVLDARIAIRRLEALSEEQYDAMQEYRDSVLDTPSCAEREGILVRIADVMEHIQRVLQHARRLEQTAESAVQLNFSAQAHRTNRIVQILTVVTVIFAPLNLLAGIYGMNFATIPGARNPYGFWIMMGTMAVVAAVLLSVFSAKRYIDRSRR